MKILKLGIVVLTLLTSITLGTATQTNLEYLTAKNSDVVCLAQNIYHEARGESLQGQLAVAQVTLNRVRSGKFQNTVCEAVYAHKQFSWTLNKYKKIKDSKAWLASVLIAKAVLTQTVHIPNFKALYFHTRQVHPRWNRKKQVVAVIGNHIFYS